MTNNAEGQHETGSHINLPYAKRLESISDPKAKRRKPVQISDCSGTVMLQSENLK
ncbi:MAG: hypothetical protein MUE65_04390 [Methanomassiliicoccales archaeon]|jgi:hypothetical protein|nr:hypothetical protein [Methanomassiliicoccales archaeon]